MSVREYRLRRYVASTPKHACPLDAVSADSRDWEFSPTDECMVSRMGSAIVGDAWPGPAGLLEAKIAARCRELFVFESAAMTDGYPTHAALYTNETDKTGTVYVRSTNGPANYQLGEEFGSTHYPTSAGNVPRFKFVPLWCEAAQLHTRCTSSTQRKYVTPGSRRHLESGTWSYFPNAQGTPLMWDRGYNEASGSGTNVLRARPWGHYPPMHAMTLGATTAATGSDATLEDGDTFYATVCFEHADGSLSPPHQVRPVSATLASGLGLYTIGTIGGTSKYRSVQFDDVPLAPEGYVARWLFATPRQKLAASTDVLTLSVEDMGLIGIIRDNVSVSFVYNGQTPQAPDPLRFRDDLRWPLRAQYAFPAEKRVVICGDLKANPAAIIIAPLDLSGGSPFSQNVADTHTNLSNFFLVRVTSTNVILKYDDGAATSVTNVAIGAATTLQDIVDGVNATTTAGSAKKWCAQLVPGVDGNILASNLALTTSSDFGDDGIVHDASTGNMRCFGPAFPGVLYFAQSYLSAFAADTDGLWMTSAQPGTAQSAPNSFVFGGYRRPARNLGRCLGGAPVIGSQTGVIAVLYYERGRCALRNVRGGSSGQDEDYQLVEIGGARGCVSWSSIGAGNGWTHAMTPDGLEVTDGDSAHVISGDVWNPEANGGRGLGEWSYELGKSAAASASGGSDTYFFVAVLGQRIRVNYRSSAASSTICDRGVSYSFADSSTARGLRELFREDGTLFGWTCPARQQLGAMARLNKSDGAHHYAAVESADSAFTTGTGRIDEFMVGTDDNGTAISHVGYSRCDALDSVRFKSGRHLDLITYNPDAALGVTYYRGTERSGGTVLTVPAVTNSVDRARVPLVVAARSRTMFAELTFTASTQPTGPVKVWGALLDFEELESVD